MRLSSTLLHWQCIHASRLMSTVNNAKIGINCNVSFAYIITNFHELLNFSNYHIWWYLYIYLTLFWLESDSLLKLLASIPDTFKKSNACHGASKNMSKSKKCNSYLMWWLVLIQEQARATMRLLRAWENSFSRNSSLCQLKDAFIRILCSFVVSLVLYSIGHSHESFLPWGMSQLKLQSKIKCQNPSRFVIWWRRNSFFNNHFFRLNGKTAWDARVFLGKKSSPGFLFKYCKKINRGELRDK